MDTGHRGFCSRYLTILLDSTGPAVSHMAEEWRVRRCRSDQYLVDPVEPVASTSRVKPIVSPDTTVDYEPDDEPGNPESTVPRNTQYSDISK